MERTTNEKLMNFRQSKGRTSEQMAETLDVSSSYYYKIEAGLRNPSYNFLYKFKDKFPTTNIDKIFFAKT